MSFRSRLQRLRALRSPSVTPETPPPPPVRPVVGIVEEFTERRIVGWISVPASTPPTPVELYVGPHVVAATHPTADVPMSGFNDPRRETGKRGVARGRRDDRRNSGQQVRVFTFQVKELWAYLGRKAKVTLRFNGQRLPIAGHGMWLSPRKGGEKSVGDLVALLEDGHKLSKSGTFVPPLEMDREWSADVAQLFGCTRTVLERRGLEPFLIYGSLLGHVRDGGPISHDNDFDAAYISAHHTGEEAAAELTEIALELRQEGVVVDLRYRTLHIHDPETDRRIDLFHSWFDDDGRFRIAWGVAGRSPFTRSDWHGTEEVTFAGGRFLAPRNPEPLLAHLYGDDWRLPKPGFNWKVSRVDAAVDGQFTDEQRSKVYWANFYAENEYRDGSSFFEFVNARAETPRTVIDIGCGDGRDACAFGAAGRRVLGLDQSSVGIEHARRKVVEHDLTTVRFEVCDIAEPGALDVALSESLEERDGPVLFYLRFVLHAITEEVQEQLLTSLRDHARPGDLIAVEFRTDKDRDAEKVHGNHYRRYQDAAEFRASLTTRFGFDEVLHEVESAGLSPYRGEDPVLCRVLARRSL